MEASTVAKEPKQKGSAPKLKVASFQTIPMEPVEAKAEVISGVAESGDGESKQWFTLSIRKTFFEFVQEQPNRTGRGKFEVDPSRTCYIGGLRGFRNLSGPPVKYCLHASGLDAAPQSRSYVSAKPRPGGSLRVEFMK